MTKRNKRTVESDKPLFIVRNKGTLCGWCLDGLHSSCKTELAYYEKLYICHCKCADAAFKRWHKTLPTKDEYHTKGHAPVEEDTDASTEATSSEPAGASDSAEASIPG